MLGEVGHVPSLRGIGSQEGDKGGRVEFGQASAGGSARWWPGVPAMLLQVAAQPGDRT